MKTLLLLLTLAFLLVANAQSLNEEKSAAINFVKRVYASAPFQGTKIVEGENKNYYLVAVNIQIEKKDTSKKYSITATKNAETIALSGFGEPCLQFEQIDEIKSPIKNQVTCLFICETISSYLSQLFLKSPFDGARILVSNSNKYIIAVITLENSKYSAISSRDRVAQMKAKQNVNTLLNGSNISSETIINTSNSNITEITESIKENSMGFISGLQLLKTINNKPEFTTYLFYANQ